MRVKPVVMPGTRTPGLSFVFTLRDNPSRASRPIF
jgi:hypothetical protein